MNGKAMPPSQLRFRCLNIFLHLSEKHKKLVWLTRENFEINHHTRASELVSIFQARSRQQNQYLCTAWARLLNAEISSNEYYIALGEISRSLTSLHDEIDNSTRRPASKEM